MVQLKNYIFELKNPEIQYITVWLSICSQGVVATVLHHTSNIIRSFVAYSKTKQPAIDTLYSTIAICY